MVESDFFGFNTIDSCIKRKAYYNNGIKLIKVEKIFAGRPYNLVNK